MTPLLQHRFQDIHTIWQGPPLGRVELIRIFTDGSHRTSGRDTFYGAAWAFSVWLTDEHGERYYGHAAHCSVSEDSPFFIGEGPDNSMTAEMLALAWAYVWALDQGVRFAAPIVVAFDCMSAGLASTGFCRPPETSSLMKMPALAEAMVLLRLCLTALVQVTPAHVHSHQGVLGNEVADQLAKAAARVNEPSQQRCLPLWPKQLLSHPLRCWAWKHLDVAPDLPTLFACPSEADRLQACPPRTNAPPLHSPPARDLSGHLFVDLRLFTYNVLTLLDPRGGAKAACEGQVGMRMFGKRDLLKQQLEELQVHVVGLQETRLPETQEAADPDWFMLHASCTPEGQFGVALWIHKQRPFVWLNQTPWRLRREHVTVVCASPRFMAVDISLSVFRCVFLVAHAPHDVPPGDSTAATAFWAEARAALSRIPQHVPLIVLADANAHVGAIPTESVGDLAASPENGAGAEWHRFLLDADLSAVNTFQHCHTGDSCTWFSPHGQGKRLDYIAIPSAWLPSARSCVVSNLELLQSRDDHRPLLASCSLSKPVHYGQYHSEPIRRAMRPSTDWLPDQIRPLKTNVSQPATVDWLVSVDVHHEAWVCSYRNAWSESAPTRPQLPRQPYLTPATLELVAWRRACRAYLAHERSELNRRRLLLAYAAFVHCRRQTAFTQQHRLVVSRWFFELDVSLARAAHGVQVSCKLIRQAVRRDRLSYLESLKQRVASQDLKNPKELFRSLRAAFPQARSARRTGFRPLPQLLLEDGSFATDSQARAERWGSYFAALEAGRAVSPEEYATDLAFQRRLTCEARAGRARFDWDALVTLQVFSHSALARHVASMG